MSDSFLKYYENELDHLRRASRRFAAEFPKIASRLQLSEQECADPYVERLLEGMAFLTARIARKMDDGLADFSETVLHLLGPEYMMPVASRAITQLSGDIAGIRLPAGAAFEAPTSLPEHTKCRFLSTEPVELSGWQALSSSYEETGLSTLSAKVGASVCGYLRADFNATGQVGSEVSFFIKLPESAACELLSLLLFECAGIILVTEDAEQLIPAAALRHRLPAESPGSLPGPAEYFILPEQTAFITLRTQGVKLPENGPFSLRFLFKKEVGSRLRLLLSEPVLQPDCVRIINAFPFRLSRVTPSWRENEHLVPEATAASDYEVLQVYEGAAYAENNAPLFKLYPFYHAEHRAMPGYGDRLNYISIHREDAIAPARKRMSPYTGSDVFMRLSGPDYTAKRDSIANIGIKALCSNRDLPLFIRKDSYLTLTSEEAAPTCKLMHGPTPPAPPLMTDEELWLGLALTQLSPGAMAAMGNDVIPALLRRLLRCMRVPGNSTAELQLNGIRTATVKSCAHTVAVQGDLCVMRGWRFELLLDESAFGGTGEFLFAATLANFLFSLCEINSYMEVRISSTSGASWSWHQHPTNP